MTIIERLKWCRHQIEMAMPLQCDYCGGKYAAYPDRYEHGSNCCMTDFAREIKEYDSYVERLEARIEALKEGLLLQPDVGRAVALVDELRKTLLLEKPNVGRIDTDGNPGGRSDS